ncbi:MAG: precorrin-8X methylmutase [Methylocapsa sp.]|nr:precorrin-8X methylmutase [Methylocapsa sp.]
MSTAGLRNRLTYLRDGAEIYRRSFATIRAEADLARFAPEEERIAVRMIHACGMIEIAADIDFSDGAVRCGRKALRQGAPILCDSKMLACGIIAARLPNHNEIVCTIDNPAAASTARERATTRSAAALELWKDRLDGAIIAIGNAPTALFRLLEILDEIPARPALIVATPVGFVGAAESKAALVANFCVPFITVKGRMGGSAMAAAALNALASDAE